MVVVKCCSVCGVVKSLDDFHRDRNRSDGHRYRCKQCVSAHGRRYREENRNKERERKRGWQEENRDKVLESNRRYYEANRDKVLEYRRRYREEIREENREYLTRQDSRRLSRRQSVTESAATKRGTWSEAEVAILMADDGRTLIAKALELGRTYHSCRGKLDRLHRTGVTN